MNRITVLQEIINKKKSKVYLEIGCKGGKCFFNIKAPKKIGIDPYLMISKKKQIFSKNKYFQMTSDEFFLKKSKILTKYGLDIVFIDGLHTFEQSLRDLINSLKFLNDDATIVMHDCNPPFEAAAFPAYNLEFVKSLNLPGWTGEWCGDVWKTIVYLRSLHKDLKIFVLDCDYGLGIINKGESKNNLNYSFEDIKNLSYKDLENNREKLLNLKNPDYFETFLNSF